MYSHTLLLEPTHIVPWLYIVSKGCVMSVPVSLCFFPAVYLTPSRIPIVSPLVFY